MKRDAIAIRVADAKREAAFWERLQTAGCKDCEHFEHHSCALAGGQIPPPHVVESGCPEWTWDGVPY